MLVVRDWMQHYESAQSRCVGKLSWVRVPNSHDTQGFCRLMAHPDSMALFGAFVLLIQVASKCAERGILTDSKGRPLDAYDIAAQCRGDVGVIQRAIQILSDDKIGWLMECPTLDQARAASGRASGAAEAERSRRYQRSDPDYEPDAEKHQPRDTEERREEEKRREKKRASERSAVPVAETPAARPPESTQGAGTGPTASAGSSTPASERGERLRPERALVDRVWHAMREKFPRVDRGLAERVTDRALQEIRANGLSPADLLEHAPELVRNATRPHMRGAAMYLETLPEEIRTSITEDS